MQKSSIQYILKLSIPIFFANLAIPMVGIIDTALMGNLGSLSYLSATSVAANLFSMIFWSFGFLRMGTVGMVSQANGRNDYTEILNIVVRNLLFVLAISITIILLQNLILSLSLKIFDLSEATRNLYEQYFKIRVYSAPGELTLYIITGLFVGLQKTKTSSLAVGFFSILNILLSIVLVTKFDLNIKGVAYGTLFSALITSIIFLIYMFWYLSKYTKITINFAQIFNLKKIKNIFNINLNIFIRTILLTFSFLWFTYLGTQIGEDYVAANAAPGDVANLSLGGGIYELTDLAVIALGAKGIYVALAAGNESEDAENHSPARAEGANLYTVSAMDINDNWASFSNFGDHVDYCAPGVNVFSTYKGGAFATMSGTSMAAPHVCGLLLLTNDNLTTDGYVNGDPDGNPDPIAHN